MNLSQLPPDALTGVLVAACGLVGVLVQRGRHETTERFDRIERQLGQVADQLHVMDMRQDRADVERAVLRNEVDTIKDRHAVVDMLHRRGVHKGSRKGLLWLGALALCCVYRWI